MWDSNLYLLVLLGTSALAYAEDEECLLAKTYKALHKYEYLYEAESLNAINGASQLRNGPKASCKVEIEVPRTCSFIIRTTGCRLSEVAEMDTDGNPVFRSAPSSSDFAHDMEKYSLKAVVEGVYDVKLYPEEGESTTILNIKRGIVSALIVPLLEENQIKYMPTIHGKCITEYAVNEWQGITDISLTRDLARCDQFVPVREHTSPLALISGMHYPLAQLIRSSHTCDYKFDNHNKHMTSAACSEKHILIPFSHKGEYGVTNIGKQSLTFEAISAHNDRVFDYNEANVKALHMEAAEDKSVIQDKEAVRALLKDLENLSETDGERRAPLFHKLVTTVRAMNAKTLSSTITMAVQQSPVLTYQVLAQCGTPECSSATMNIIKRYGSSSLQLDAAVYAIGLLSNPSPLLIHDMLAMAKYKPSKPILYALSIAVKRFYKAKQELIPEIHSVADFMTSQLGDCSGDTDNTFLTLRVIGNMAEAIGAASPALKMAVIQCVNKPTASLAVQQAAIQVFRLTPLPEEGREVLMQVLMDSNSPVQKRVAAYLVLMKDPQPSELAQLFVALPKEQDQQTKSFVFSHITNILSSTQPETESLREMIRAALQGNEIGAVMDPTTFSRNYKFGSLESNMIFEGTSGLPKEAMLEMTLKAFGFDLDMMEIGMDGKGFEPTIEALFGKGGFFPDSAMKTMYFMMDNSPFPVNELLSVMLPTERNNRKRRQASQSLIREIGENIKKLVMKVEAHDYPEAMVYLSILGNELGYMKTNDLNEMAYSASMMIQNMLKMVSPEAIRRLITSTTDNNIFAHYIFMDNEFFLPTAIGVPLRFALSGTFTPGIKGGLNIARDMSKLKFMPSAGIEFVTQVGSHIPGYVHSGLEMHTNLFHGSGMKAQISTERYNIKLTIPVPKDPTKLISITNSLVAANGAEVKAIPPMVTDKVVVNECTPFFAGMKYCAALEYTDAFSHETAPYFPITGDSKMAVELHYSEDVTEYSATIAYEFLRDDEGDPVDALKLILRAEAAEPTEATVTMKYNKKTHVLSTNIQIPDIDVDAGFRLGVDDGSTNDKRTHTITLQFINKVIPQLSLIGHANLEARKEGMLQVQMLVPVLEAEATLTANMKNDKELVYELESNISLLDSASTQKLSVKYDSSRIEVDVKSDIKSGVLDILVCDQVKLYVNNILDKRVGDTDMKVRHIVTKSVEATNNYLEKYTTDIPYLHKIRVPDMPEMSMPEALFMNVEAKAVYYFNNDRFIISIPLPLGGKSTQKSLGFPPALTTPHFSMPEFGLEILSVKIPIPEVIVPVQITISVPLFGKAEISTIVKSNLYDLDASMAVGKDVGEAPSCSAMFDVKGTSPLDILSVRMQGSGMLSTSDHIKAHLKSSLVHKFINAHINILEDATVTDGIKLRSTSRIEATSPIGFNISLEHTGIAGINREEISAESKFEGILKVGPISDKTIFTQSFNIFPFRPEAKMDSNIIIDSTIFKGKHTTAATFLNGDICILTNSNTFNDMLTQTAEFSFKEQKLSLKCDTNGLGFGMKFHNEAEVTAGAGVVLLKMETSADQFENRVYSLFTASLDDSGLAFNSDATVKLLENQATHKATLRMNKDGLVTSGTNSVQSPLTFSNAFKAGLDASSATLTIKNNAALLDISVDNTNSLTITLSSLDFSSKTSVGDDTSYTHDIGIAFKPYTVSANMNTNLKVLDANVINQAQLEAELYKVHLTGSVKTIYDDEEIKHTYDIKYADMTVAAKCSTNGKVFGTHMSHNAEVEVVGLAAIFSNDARFNSQLMRFDHTIRASIVPFDFNLDAIFNADGDLMLYGKQSAQLYSKFLLKAQPLALASSHEYRASVTQQFNNGASMETTIDHKVDTLLSPQEQQTNLRITSKMNGHAFNQDFSVYNTPERIGLEVSGAMLTNMLNTASTENQEFSVSGFLKYDKNTNSHMIQLPLIENVPTFLEIIKVTFVSIAEALQNIINNEQVRAKLEALPELVSDFFAQLNIKNIAVQLKQYVTSFTQQYTISMKDLEDCMTILNTAVEKLFAELSTHFDTLKEIIVSSPLFDAFIQKVQEGMEAFIESDVSVIVAELKSFFLNIKFKDLVALPRDIISTLTVYVTEFIQDFKIIDTINAFCSKIREIITNLEIAGNIELIVEIIAEYVNKFIDGIAKIIYAFTIQVKTMEIPTKCMQVLENAINYIKATEVKDMLEHLNDYLNTLIVQSRSLDYNWFVEKVNQNIAIDTMHVNNLIQALEIPQNLDTVIEHSNTLLESIGKGFEISRSITVSDFIEFVKRVFDLVVLKDLKTFADIVKHDISVIDIRSEMTFYLRQISKYYIKFIAGINNLFTYVVNVIDILISDNEVISEIKQIIKGLITALNTAELNTPYFTFPLTDIVIPSVKFSMDKLHEINIPTQIDIPEFKIMGFYTVPAVTISADVIRQRIIELINFIVSFDYVPAMENPFGDLKLNYLPPMPDITFPEINFRIRAPVIPKIPVENLVKTLRIPEIRLPTISSEIMVPCFGKLYGEIQFKTPIYSIKTSAELQNSTENAMNPLLVGFFSSEATAPFFEALNYKLGSTAHIAFPKMRRAIIKETVQFIHPALEVDHQASVTLYGPPSPSAQAKSRTIATVITAPYTAKFVNNEAIAIAGGITASMDTTYNHVVTLPIIEFTSETNLVRKAYAKLDGTTFTLTVDTEGTN